MKRIPYSWVVVGLSFVAVTVSIGIKQSIIILFPALLEEFQWSRAILSVAPALAGIFTTMVEIRDVQRDMVNFRDEQWPLEKLLLLAEHEQMKNALEVLDADVMDLEDEVRDLQ